MYIGVLFSEKLMKTIFVDTIQAFLSEMYNVNLYQ